MRSIWNGAISFGLVSIPIKLVNATESHSISFRQIHLEDGGRIRYRKFCELEEKEVASAEIGKGYEAADGAIIPITEEDLASLPIPTARTIEIVAFVPGDRIDPLQMDAAYYLSANGVPAAKPYTLLREALKRNKKVAIAKFALRGRERLGMLRVVDDVIAMHGLLWPDEVRAPEEAAPETEVTVREAELDLADALMDTLGEVDMESLHDDYRSAVEEMIEAKASGEGVVQAPAAPEGGGKVIDLMAALKSSVKAAKEARGDAAAPEREAKVSPVTPLKSRTAPKEVGGKKSTSTKPKPAASGSGTARKTTAKKSAASSRTTAGEKASTSRASTSKASTAKAGTSKASGSKASASKATAKKATAKKAPAKKAASRRRAS
ncbi:MULTISPECIES: non-homologous end joining protein Ku [unclassified Streptomyces]|uniref:non-homologous end joining protein Ku n=1 Tax=unclassified Streptomyces TaxID=2593676 RepID=UPI002DDA0356|nr:Ku protein [Streptomyces sp. NBC_01445]WSE05129.1 Ku protein [Streptomyces sp. NBC_01445]